MKYLTNLPNFIPTASRYSQPCWKFLLKAIKTNLPLPGDSNPN